MEKRASPKRIIMNVPDELHKRIKLNATYKNISITAWILEAIVVKMQEEDKYK